MGNDGGSIPTRRELVKNAARNPNTSELKATQLEAQTHAWAYCPLSQRPLSDPIVSDSSGTLYNKDAIIEHLLPNPDAETKDQDDVLKGRVRGIRDVVEVKFRHEKDGAGERRICPLTNKELGPHNKAVYLVPCGHAFSELAIREVKDTTCPECSDPYQADDVIPILPVSPEDVARLAARATALKDAGLTHSLKKTPGSKKKKNKKSEAAHANGEGTRASAMSAAPDMPTSKAATPANGAHKREHSPPAPSRNAGIKHAATASLTARVLEEQEERNKRRKMAMNDNIRSLFAADKRDGHGKNSDYMTRGYSVPNRR